MMKYAKIILLFIPAIILLLIGYAENQSGEKNPKKEKAAVNWSLVTLKVNPPRNFIYFENQDITFNVVLNNTNSESASCDLRCKVSNVYGEQVYQNTYAVSISSGGSQVLLISIPPQVSSWYSVSFEFILNNNVFDTRPSSFSVIQKVPEFKYPEKSPFALCGGSLFHITLAEHNNLGRRRLDLHRAAGAFVGRNDLWWSNIEVSQGIWQFDKADSTVNLFNEYGINLLGILCYSSAWSTNGYAPQNDTEINQFVNYAKTLASRYKGKVKMWEVWNEPNLSEFWSPYPNATIYSSLLTKTYTELKTADPSLKIIGMVTSLVDLTFIESCFKLGAGAYMDAISVHPYQDPTPPTNMNAEIGKIYTLKTLMVKYNVNVPIWITECGWQTMSMPLNTQAIYLVKYYVELVSRKIVEKIYWFNLDDWQPRGSSVCCQYGILYDDQTPKPSFMAYHVMTSLLHDFTDISKLTGMPTGITAFKSTFEDRNPIYIYWTDSGTKNASVPDDVNTKIDIYGKSESVYSGNTIPITTSPSYFTNIVENANQLLLY